MIFKIKTLFEWNEILCVLCSEPVSLNRPRERASPPRYCKGKKGVYLSRARAQVSFHTRESDKSPEQRSMAAYIQAVFVSVTGVAGITWLARQDECISCLFLVNMTQVLETVVWSLPFPPVLRSYRGIFLSVLRHSLILLSKHKQLYCIYAFLYKGYKSIDNTWAEGKH